MTQPNLGSHLGKRQQPMFQTFDRCPLNNEKAISIDIVKFHVRNGQIIWWQCSTCRSWHVTVVSCPEEAGREEICGESRI